MADLNATLSFLSPYYSTVEQIVGTISLLVGGIFGIYLISLIVRLIFFKKMYKSYDEIKNYLKRLEAKIDKISKIKR